MLTSLLWVAGGGDGGLHVSYIHTYVSIYTLFWLHKTVALHYGMSICFLHAKNILSGVAMYFIISAGASENS